MTAASLEFLAIFSIEILVLHLFFRWIEKRWPERSFVDISHIPADVRKRIAKRANRLGTLFAFVATPFLTAVWAYGFYRLQFMMIPEIPGTRFVRWPTAAIHLLPGIFAGIALAGPLGLLVMRLVYWRRFDVVMATGDAQFQFDVRKWMYATFVWIVPLCVDAETLWLGRFVIFTDDGIVSRSVLERRSVVRSYTEIAALYGIDGTRLIGTQVFPDRRFVIVFKDGSSVPTPRFDYHDGRPEDLEPLKLAAKKSGVPIQWVTEFP